MSDVDVLFEWLEKDPLPGFQADVVGGAVFASPRLKGHRRITLRIADQLAARYPRKAAKKLRYASIYRATGTASLPM